MAGLGVVSVWQAEARFSLPHLCDSEDINRAWENIKENIKTSAKESLDVHKLK